MINLSKVYKIFFYIFFLIFFSFLILITLNTKLRNFTLHSLVNSYKVYMIVSLQEYLKKPEPNFKEINKKLLSYINVSKKISSGKSKLLIGIYDAANLVQSNIADEKKFSYLEEFFYKLLELDPDLYEAKIWYAKALYANNKFDEAKKQIDEAIKMSSLDPDPYRLGIKIALNEKNIKELNLFCTKYLNAKLGGKEKDTS